jgi:hypothetical protein
MIPGIFNFNWDNYHSIKVPLLFTKYQRSKLSLLSFCGDIVNSQSFYFAFKAKNILTLIFAVF